MAKTKTRRLLVSRASNFGASLLSELEKISIFSSLTSTPELLNKGLIKGTLLLDNPISVIITEMENGERIVVPDGDSVHRLIQNEKYTYSIYNFSKDPISIINKRNFVINDYLGTENTSTLYTSIPVPIYTMSDGIKMRDIFFLTKETISGLFHG